MRQIPVHDYVRSYVEDGGRVILWVAPYGSGCADIEEVHSSLNGWHAIERPEAMLGQVHSARCFVFTRPG